MDDNSFFPGAGFANVETGQNQGWYIVLSGDDLEKTNDLLKELDYLLAGEIALGDGGMVTGRAPLEVVLVIVDSLLYPVRSQ